MPDIDYWEDGLPEEGEEQTGGEQSPPTGENPPEDLGPLWHIPEDLWLLARDILDHVYNLDEVVDPSMIRWTGFYSAGEVFDWLERLGLSNIGAVAYYAGAFFPLIDDSDMVRLNAMLGYRNG